MPHLLLLDTFGIGLEVIHEVLNLLDLGFSIGVQDDRKVLHQVEVGSHGVSQAGQLTEFGDKGDLVTRSPVLVDQQWLIHVLDALVIASLVVVCVARRSTLLVKGCCGTLSEIYSVDPVGLLVVASHDSHTTNGLLDCFLSILASSFGLFFQVTHELQAVVSSDDFEANVNVEQTARLFHDESGVKSGPNFDVVGRQSMCLRLVELLLANCLELEGAHHRVEKDLQEVHVIFVSFLHDLHPLDLDSVLSCIVFRFKDWQLGDLL